MNNNKVSLTKTVLFTVCSILVLDSFVAPTIIGVSSITIWIISAIFFFLPYGLMSAELGSTYPDDGGIVSWVQRAFGEFWGVMEGWMYWINVAFWMPAVFTAFSGWLVLAIWPDMPVFLQAAIAIAMCWVIVYIGVKGIDLSVEVASIMAYLKMGILVLLGVLGIVYGIKNGFANDFSFENWIPTVSDIINPQDGGYFAVIVYNLLGFELIGSIGSQIEDAKHTVPKMTIIAGIAIVAIYCFGSFGVLAAIPADSIDEVDGFVYALKELCTVFGPLANIVFYIVIFGAILTLVANMITWTLGGNESFMAADLDKRSKFLGHRHPKYGTADNLYYVMGVISSLLLVLNYTLSGNANEVFWTIFAFSSIVFMLCYLLMFPAALKLKFTDNTPRVYEVPGGKAGMVIIFILCMFSVGIATFSLLDLDPSGYGFWMQWIGLILTFGVGIYLYFAGKKK
ncbi:MAG: APC family permease [Erysipelotrichaceae bacterium]|jgi:amino acid transporter|nr:APC family permease [Erysipelotrichaceae bacterium]